MRGAAGGRESRLVPHERAAARSGRDACSGDLVASFAAGPGRDHVCGTGSADGAVLVWRDAVLVTVLSAVHLGPVLDLAVHLPPKDGPAGSIRSGGGGDDGAASRKEPAVVVTAGRDGWLRFLEVACSGGDGEATRVEPGVLVAEATKDLVRRPADAGPVSLRAVAVKQRVSDGVWHVLAGTAGDELWLITLPHLRTAPSRYNSEPTPDGQRCEYLSVADGGGGRLPAVECVVQAHAPAEDAEPGDGGGGAIAVHPSREDEFVTCGADGVLRVWDALGCRPMFAMTLHHTLHHGTDSEPGADGADDGAGRDGGATGRGGWSLVAAEYSSEWGDCCHLAVAMVPRGPGAARSRAESSRVVVLRISDAEAGREIPVVCVLARREGLANRRVTCLRYSAGAEGADDDDDDGGGSVRLLAVGTWDGSIVIYAADLADDSYVRRAVLRGHSRPVTSLDFAAGLEPASLQSNSAWELKFWDMAAMRARKTPSADRDTRWCRAAAPLPARAVHRAAPCWGPRHSPPSAAARGFVAGKLKAGKAAVAAAAASGVNSHAAQAPCAPPCAR